MMESTHKDKKKMVKAISVGAYFGTYYFSEPSVSNMGNGPKIMVLRWITSET